MIAPRMTVSERAAITAARARLLAAYLAAQAAIVKGDR